MRTRIVTPAQPRAHAQTRRLGLGSKPEAHHRVPRLTREEIAKGDPAVEGLVGGPSVTFRLRDRLTLPSRNDEQVLEIARLELTPKFYYKAVPVLTPQVYRLADLVNTTDYVLLPGEATMYHGADFVGRMNLPLVAIGEQFTAGFGSDPQLQVQRQMMDKSRAMQGGNQVLKFEYRILLSSYKPERVKVQVWDRLPAAENETMGVSLVKAAPELCRDPMYLREEAQFLADVVAAAPRGERVLWGLDREIFSDRRTNRIITVKYWYLREALRFGAHSRPGMRYPEWEMEKLVEGLFCALVIARRHADATTEAHALALLDMLARLREVHEKYATGEPDDGADGTAEYRAELALLEEIGESETAH